METMTKEDGVKAARESFSGRTLTDGQFAEAWAIAGILNKEIHRSGSFKEKLTDYAHAFARSEKFDALRGESILRHVHRGRFQQTLNQTREALMEREEKLPENVLDRALVHAESIAVMIQEGETRPFYQPMMPRPFGFPRNSTSRRRVPRLSSRMHTRVCTSATSMRPVRKSRTPTTSQCVRQRSPRARPNSCNPAPAASP